jgi:hypothetical protein
VLLSGAVLWLTGFGVLAQEPGFFPGDSAVGLTAEQASRGKVVYDDNCGNCHGTNLDNGEFGPPLRGSAFQMRWASQSANALFTYIATKMPPAAPGGLSDRAYSKEIRTANVRDLGIAWSLALPVSANEITPLVHDGILFVESGASIQALNGATGEVLWQYTRSLRKGCTMARRRG